MRTEEEQTEPTETPPPQRAPRKRRRPWGLFFLVGVVLAGFGSCVVTVVGVLPKGVPERTVLELDLEAGFRKPAGADPLAAALEKGRPTLREVIGALERAKGDPRVVGLVARIGSGGHGLAAIQELRDAVRRFSESGKPAIAWADTFGEGIPGAGGYYLATAFDEIWLQPSGDLTLLGLSAEAPFLKGTLEKLDVEPRFARRHEYKTFINQFTEAEFTKEHRESLEHVLREQERQIVEGIAKARGLLEEKVRRLLLDGPFSAQQALAAGLVDALGYRDEVLAAVEKKLGEDIERLYAHVYLRRAGRPQTSGPVLAYIEARGGITRGESSYDPLLGGATVGADTLSAALRAAGRDPEVKAVVLRVESPGGSYVASDTVYRAIRRLRDAGKPVVVSMGNVAASGGYFIAMAADRIVAEPGTITGSIGVAGGKLVLRGLFEKLGITWGLIETTPQAGMFSPMRDFSDVEWQRFSAWLDCIYEDFVQKAADARGMSFEEMDRVARGRIWTGADAKERGLIDALGGVDVAVRTAKELAGIAEDTEVTLCRFPPTLDPVQALLLFLAGEEGENSDWLPGRPSAKALSGGADQLLLKLRQLEGGAGADVLALPPSLRVLWGGTL